MSVEIAWKQNILVTDFHLLKSLLVVLGFGSQAFVCGFSRQNINSVRQTGSNLSKIEHYFNLILISYPSIGKLTTNIILIYSNWKLPRKQRTVPRQKSMLLERRITKFQSNFSPHVINQSRIYKFGRGLVTLFTFL
jgi:hypothetical protein